MSRKFLMRVSQRSQFCSDGCSFFSPVIRNEVSAVTKKIKHAKRDLLREDEMDIPIHIVTNSHVISHASTTVDTERAGKRSNPPWRSTSLKKTITTAFKLVEEIHRSSWMEPTLTVPSSRVQQFLETLSCH